MDSKNKGQKGLNISTIAWMAVPVLLLIAYLFYIHLLQQSWELTAQFGDMFGGVNAIFSGVAILIMAISLKLQRKDLLDHGKSLDEQVQIMKASAFAPLIDEEEERIYRELDANFQAKLDDSNIIVVRSQPGKKLSDTIRGDSLHLTIKLITDKLQEIQEEVTLLVQIRTEGMIDDKACLKENTLNELSKTLQTFREKLNKVKALRLKRQDIFKFLMEYEDSNS